MASATFRLKVPAFDLTFYEISYQEHPYVFLLSPGGGGSAKSGVKNQIMIAKANYPPEKLEYEPLDGFLTDTSDLSALCTGISTGTLTVGNEDRDMILANVNQFCFVFQANVNNDDKKTLKLTKKLQFQADFAEECPSLNTTLLTSYGMIVTGGDDAIIRTWIVTTDKGEDQWAVSKLFELKDHTAPITSLCEHPSESWFCSSGKDGSCKIWSIKTGRLLVNIPFLIDGIKGFDPNKMKMECRGCSFSLDGSSLFSIQSPRKGSTYIIKWGLEKREEKEEKEEKEKDNKDKAKEKSSSKPFLVAYPEKKKEVHKIPSTRLAISEDGEFLAIGASDGSVAVVKSQNFQEMKRVSCHDLPVTGLAFAPHHLTKEKELDFFLATCSADNKLNLIKVKGYSTIGRLLLILLLILVILLLFFFATQMGFDLMNRLTN